MDINYWASLPADELARRLQGKIDAYYNWILTSGRLGRWRLAFETYYGDRGSHNSYSINSAGDQGELSFLMSNEYRNLLQHLVRMTTKSRPVAQCSAVNTDTKSQAQTVLGEGLLEYYFSDGQIEDHLEIALEISLVMDSSWIFTVWDHNRGEEVAVNPETNVPVQAGDVYTRTRTPLDVIIDFTRPQAPTRQDWRMVHDYENKWDLAAVYTEKREELIASSRDNAKDSLFRFGDVVTAQGLGSETDDIDVYTFFHPKTPAMPQGRMFIMAGSQIPLFDGPLPYKRVPGTRVCPTEMMLSALGYSNCNDLLALQDVLDALISAGVTNMTSVGVNNIWVKSKAGFSFEQLAKGMNLIQAEDKPESLVLAQLPAAWLQITNFIVARMEALSGMNATARGNVTGDMSGAALALLQSMAIEFNSGMQKAYTRAIEEVGMDHLSLLQDFATSPRVASIGGANQRYMLPKFSGDQIDKIKRVYVRQGNALSKTPSGNMVIAKELLQIPGAVDSAEKFLEVLETGKVKPILETKQKELYTIRDENERMARGELPQAVFTENPQLHIDGHRAVLLDVEAKKDPQLIKILSQHIQQHMMLWATTNPITLAMFGFPPPPQPQLAMMPVSGGPPMGGGPPPQGGPPGAAPPKGPNNPGASQVKQSHPQNPDVGMPNQPQLPKNALTGNQWDPNTGGLNE